MDKNEPKRMTFFSSYWIAAQRMPKKDRLSFFEAIFSYAFDDRLIEMTPAAEAAFTLVLPVLDASRKRSAAGRKGGSVRKATASVQCLDAEANTKQNESTLETNVPGSGKQNESDNKEKEKDKDKEKEEKKEERKAQSAAFDAQMSVAAETASQEKEKGKGVRHKYGEFGWVLLTEEQYQKLMKDLGEQELGRCIRYVDESAQKTGNRAGWKDWNLVIRSCHRDGWGLRNERRGEYGPGGRSGEPEKQERKWEIVYD